MKIADKIKKMKDSMKVKTFKELTEDKGGMVETTHVEDEDGRIVSTFVKKDGVLLESSATQDSQESGTHEKAAKKAGEKEENLTYTSSSMASAQAGVTAEAVTKDKEFDNDQESEKAKFGFAKLKSKKPKTKPTQSKKPDNSMSKIADQDTANENTWLEEPETLSKAYNINRAVKPNLAKSDVLDKTDDDDDEYPVSIWPTSNIMALNDIAGELEREAENKHISRNFQPLRKADPPQPVAPEQPVAPKQPVAPDEHDLKYTEDRHIGNLDPMADEDQLSPDQFAKKWNEGYQPIKGMSILSAGESNTKVRHGMEDSGGATHAAILHFAPADLAGVGNMCPMFGLCGRPCLVSSGQGGTWDESGGFNKATIARLAKTQLFADHPDAFWKLLIQDMHNHVNQAKKLNAKPAVRLNGTSDIAWEKIRPKILGGMNIFQAFPDVQFWDYTKRFDRLEVNKHSNYHLTFSADSVHNRRNMMEVQKALKAGYNVAVPFGGINTKRSPSKKTGKGGTIPGKLPEQYGFGNQLYDVIDGDESDFRFLDHTKRKDTTGQIVGLRAKGDGKKDYTDFVRWDHSLAQDPQAKRATANFIKDNGFSPFDTVAKKEAMKRLDHDLNIKTNLIKKMIQTPEMQAKISTRKALFISEANRKLRAIIGSVKKRTRKKTEKNLIKAEPGDEDKYAKAKAMLAGLNSKYSDKVNSRVEAIKAANAERQELPVDQQVANIKAKYAANKSLAKSDLLKKDDSPEEKSRIHKMIDSMIAAKKAGRAKSSGASAADNIKDVAKTPDLLCPDQFRCSPNDYKSAKRNNMEANAGNQLKHLWTFHHTDDHGDQTGGKLSVFLASHPKHKDLIGAHIHLDSTPGMVPSSWPSELHSRVEDASNHGFDKVIVHTPESESASSPQTPKPVKTPPNLKIVKSKMGKADGDSEDKSRIRKMIDAMAAAKKAGRAKTGGSKTGGSSTEDKIKNAMKTHGRGVPNDGKNTPSVSGGFRPSARERPPSIKEKAESAKDEMLSRGRDKEHRDRDGMKRQIYSNVNGPEMLAHLDKFNELEASLKKRAYEKVPGHAPHVAYMGEHNGNHYFSTQGASSGSFVIGADKKVTSIPKAPHDYMMTDYDYPDETGNRVESTKSMDEATADYAKWGRNKPTKSHIAAITAHPKGAGLLGKKKIRPLDQPHPRDYKVSQRGTGWHARIGSDGGFDFIPKEGSPGTYSMHDYNINYDSPEKQAKYAKVFEHIISQNPKFKAAHPNGAKYEGPEPKPENVADLNVPRFESDRPKPKPFISSGSDKSRSHLKVIKSMSIEGLFKACKSITMAKTMDGGNDMDLGYSAKGIASIKGAFGTPPPPPPPTASTDTGSLGGNITGAIKRMGKAEDKPFNPPGRVSMNSNKPGKRVNTVGIISGKTTTGKPIFETFDKNMTEKAGYSQADHHEASAFHTSQSKALGAQAAQLEAKDPAAGASLRVKAGHHAKQAAAHWAEAKAPSLLGKSGKTTDTLKYCRDKMSYHKRAAAKAAAGSQMRKYHTKEHDKHWDMYKQYAALKRSRSLNKADDGTTPKPHHFDRTYNKAPQSLPKIAPGLKPKAHSFPDRGPKAATDLQNPKAHEKMNTLVKSCRTCLEKSKEDIAVIGA